MPNAPNPAQLILAVLLAVGLAHALGLEDCWWAAISAFVILQSDCAASVARGAMRVAGTAAGALLGWWAAPLLAPHPVSFVIVMGVAAWAGLFAALALRHAYAWTLLIVTFVMVMCEGRSTTGALAAFAALRTANVIVGVLAAVAVATLRNAMLRGRRGPSPAHGAALPRVGNEVQVDPGHALRHAMPGAIAVAIMAALWCWHDMHALAQGMVTAIAVLIVPPHAMSAAEAKGRMLQRLAGCLLAAALALALLPIVGGHPLACQVALCAGVWLGAHMQARSARWRYAAIQFTVAFLMVFVQDGGWHADVQAAVARFAGIATGAALTMAVLLSLDGVRATLRDVRRRV